MLATLERPAERSVILPISCTDAPEVVLRAPRAVLRAPRAAGPHRATPPASVPHSGWSVRTQLSKPALGATRFPAKSPDRTNRPTVPETLRMTVRARRLLAGLALFCAAVLGVLAVDAVAALVPAASSTSYPSQVASYTGVASAESGGLLPAAGTEITVGTGDSLWTLAESVDPDADPRTVIAAIMVLNGLDSPTLQPGQVLRLP